MKISQAFTMAIKAIVGNKMRTFLTVLGIVVGVVAVIALIALGAGSQASINEQMSTLGTNLIVVSITTPRQVNINVGDVTAMVEGSPDITAVSPVVSQSNIKIRANGKDTTTRIEATNPAYSEIRSVTVQEGRFLQQSDLDNRFSVALVGVDVADELWGTTTDVVGKRFSALGREFQVVGVLEKKGSSMVGNDDNRIIIPLTTGQRIMYQRVPRQYYFEAASSEDTSDAIAAIKKFFLAKLRDEDNFNILDQSSIMDTVNSALGTLTGMLSGIAAISLLVGGIGIMNIMLVSVTERTREIGIRKAIGAKRRDILLQFLIEAGMISGFGGLIGLGLGYAMSIGLASILGIKAVVTGDTIILALGFSIGMGMIFGMYPANKASKLRPIDALRYE